MKKQNSHPDLQDEIDEICEFESDRPTPIELHIDNGPRSMRPKLPDTLLAKVIAIVLALGAIAEVVHEIVK